MSLRDRFSASLKSKVYFFLDFQILCLNYFRKGQVIVMENGRRKIRICLFSIVLAAVVIGIFYYYYSGNSQVRSSEGTLIQGPRVESYGC